jgi:uncharacterized protein YukE
MSVDVIADLDGLSTLGQRMRNVADDLKHTDRTFDGDAVHSHDIAEKLDDFSGRWSDKRKKLAEVLDQSAHAISDISDAFRSVDDALAQALRGCLSGTPNETVPARPRARGATWTIGAMRSSARRRDEW